jgi:hypothetical protein
VQLIVYYVIFMIAGDLAAYFIGLVTEREFGSEASLIVFLTLYFLFLWVSLGTCGARDKAEAYRISGHLNPHDWRLVELGSKAAKALRLIYAPLRGPPYPSHRCKQQATGNPEDHERSQYKGPQSNCIGVPCNQSLHKATWRHKLC